jgi:hypothetical protein
MVNCREEFGATPLHFAALEGHANVSTKSHLHTPFTHERLQFCLGKPVQMSILEKVGLLLYFLLAVLNRGTAIDNQTPLEVAQAKNHQHDVWRTL